MGRVLYAIDRVNDYMGKLGAWIFIPLTILIVYEVTCRYVFNAPTIWVWDVNCQLQAAIVGLGGGYALLHKMHVSIDVLVSGLSRRRRAALDAVMDVLLVSGVGLFIWRAWVDVLRSVLIREHWTSAWAPVIYPLKVVILVGVGAMLLEGVAIWLRNILTLIHGGEAVSNEH